MRIGELSRRTGVSIRSLRHYEDKGLIKPARLENSYRDYDESIIERILAIRAYLELGLTTDEIRKILTCTILETPGRLHDWKAGLYTIYERKVQVITAEIQALQKTRERLLTKMETI